MRLQVAISHAGVASRRKAAMLIEAGFVEVNDKIVREKGLAVDPERDRIKVEGRYLKREARKVYLLINKPKGVITTAADEKGRKTVLHLLPRIVERLYPVGRLDKDTTGLLLLTNDGELAYRITHPSFEIEKIYHVEVKGCTSPQTLEKLRKGIFVDGKRTLPTSITVLKQDKRKTILTIKLHEGRKRQVRRMFEVQGHPVAKLKRVSIGNLKLGELGPGCYRGITRGELKELKSMVGMK